MKREREKERRGGGGGERVWKKGNHPLFGPPVFEKIPGALTRKLSKKCGYFHFYSDFSFPPCFLLILSMPFTIRILTPITPITANLIFGLPLNAYLETLRYQERLFALLCRNYVSEIAPQCG